MSSFIDYFLNGSMYIQAGSDVNMYILTGFQSNKTNHGFICYWYTNTLKIHINIMFIID